MSTVGLEHSSFINPELTWKTISKGRSTVRSARRPASKNLNMGHEQKKSPKRTESQRSESVKTGNIRQLNDNLEHLPIKKRRFLFRSCSPTPQSPREKSPGPENNKCTSDNPIIALPQKVENEFTRAETSLIDPLDSSIGGKIQKTRDEVNVRGHDFSGIEILAAAACTHMLDKPSANIMSPAVVESIATQEKNAVVEVQNKVEEPLPSVEMHSKAEESLPSVEIQNGVEEALPTVETQNEVKEALPSVEIQNIVEESLPSVEIRNNVEEPLPTIEIQNKVEESLPSVEIQNTVEESLPLVEIQNKVEESLPSVEIQNKVGESLPLVGIQNEVGESLPSAGIQIEVGESLPSAGIQNEVEVSLPSVVIQNDVEGPMPKSIGATCQTSEGTKTSDVRLHWDLNAPMDEWEHPLDDTVSSGSKPDTVNVDYLANMEPSNMQTEQLSTRQPSVDEIDMSEAISSVTDSVSVTELALIKSCDTGKSRVDASEALLESKQNGFGLCSNVEEHVAGLSSCSKSGIKNPSDVGHVQVVEKFEAVDFRLDLGSHDFNTSSFEGGCIEAVSNLHNLNKEGPAPAVQGDNSGKSEVDLSFKTVPTQAKCDHEAPLCEAADNSTKAMESDIGKEDLREHHFHPFQFNPMPLGKQELPLLHVREYEGAAVVKKLNDVAFLKDDKVSREIPELNEVETEATNACDPLEAGQLAVELASTGALESEVHVCDTHDTRCEDMAEPEKRNDSYRSKLGGCDPFLEDGELRESEHSLEDNDGENREVEHVDYDSDNIDEFEFTDAADGPVAEKVVAEVVCERQGSHSNERLEYEGGLPIVEKNVEEHNLCHQTASLAEGDADVECTKPNPSTSKPIIASRRSSVDNPEVVDMDLDEGRKSSIVSVDAMEDQNDGLGDTGGVRVKGAGTKDFRREFQPRFEGPSDRRVTDTAAPRSRYSGMNHSCYRDERTIGVDGSYGRNRYMNSDYGGRPGRRYWNQGSRGVVANSTNEGDDVRFLGPSDDTPMEAHRQGMFPASRGGHIQHARTGSPAERDEEYGMGPIMKTRDFNSDSSQRNSRYDRNVSGMGRGGYQRTIRDAPNTSGSMPNHFIRREHNFSSGGSRIGPHHPRRSQSRSRTRSPDPRHDGRMGRGRMQYQAPGYFRERRSPVRVFCPGQRFETTSGRLRSDNCRPVTRPGRFVDMSPPGRMREYENDDEYKRPTYLPRNQRSRSRSCSPEFRSEGRMGTMRLPYPPSNDAADHMPDRRSPPRMFRPGKRFNDMGSPRRLRSDDYVRPISRPVRFQDAAQPSSRGNDFEGGDDYRRKSRTIFDRIHPKRNNYDVEGDDRPPFEYDSKERVPPQSFRRGDGYGRGGGDSRRAVDAAPGGREERNNVRYNSDRIYPTGGPKPFGIREYSDDALPRNQTPE